MILNRFVSHRELLSTGIIRHNRDDGSDLTTILPIVGLIESHNIHSTMGISLEELQTSTQNHCFGIIINDSNEIRRKISEQNMNRG
jgi:hypothetical protein